MGAVSFLLQIVSKNAYLAGKSGRYALKTIVFFCSFWIKKETSLYAYDQGELAKMVSLVSRRRIYSGGRYMKV